VDIPLKLPGPVVGTAAHAAPNGVPVIAESLAIGLALVIGADDVDGIADEAAAFGVFAAASLFLELLHALADNAIVIAAPATASVLREMVFTASPSDVR
jgi:hypothetical protein